MNLFYPQTDKKKEQIIRKILDIGSDNQPIIGPSQIKNVSYSFEALLSNLRGVFVPLHDNFSANAISSVIRWES